MPDTPFHKMPEPPAPEKGPIVAGPSGQAAGERDLTVYFAPSATDAETRGMTDELRLSLAEFSERIVQTMDRFSEKYKWEVEINGEIKVYGVFSGSAKLTFSPKG